MLGWGIVGVKHGFVLLCVVLLGIETTTHVSLHQAKNDLGFGALILHRGSLAEEAVVVNILPCGGTACGARGTASVGDVCPLVQWRDHLS